MCLDSFLSRVLAHVEIFTLRNTMLTELNQVLYLLSVPSALSAHA